MDPLSAEDSPDVQAYRYSLTLTAVKSFYRVCDGVQTMFLVNRNGYVLDIVDLDQWRRSRSDAADRGDVSDALHGARAGHRRQPEHLRRPQPEPRDQGVR